MVTKIGYKILVEGKFPVTLPQFLNLKHITELVELT
jgi:hypothetical protein